MLIKHETKTIFFYLTEHNENTPKCSLYQPVARS